MKIQINQDEGEVTIKMDLIDARWVLSSASNSAQEIVNKKITETPEYWQEFSDELFDARQKLNNKKIRHI